MEREILIGAWLFHVMRCMQKLRVTDFSFVVRSVSEGVNLVACVLYKDEDWGGAPKANLRRYDRIGR